MQDLTNFFINPIQHPTIREGEMAEGRFPGQNLVHGPEGAIPDSDSPE
jgi:hypothetical protein